MEEVFKIIIGVVVLLLGVPIGNILAKNTPEELKDGRKWFFLVINISLLCAILSLIFKQDALMFTFLFIAIVTSRSVVEKQHPHRKKRKSKRT